MRLLPAPSYDGSKPRCTCNPRVMLSVFDMATHMTNEGNQLQNGLGDSGYHLIGHGYPHKNETDVRKILDYYDPGVVVVQDKREWMGLTADRRQERAARFRNVSDLKARDDIFKVCVLKDAQNDNAFQRESADEVGCHAWITYYHPTAVCRVAPFVRREHIIRTWHTVDQDQVPEYTDKDRKGCLLSGAIGRCYPLRKRLSEQHSDLPEVTVLHHPGYHRCGAATPVYLETLSQYKVAICTASVYGYALRKIIEATACGCIVITDLPASDHLPLIDGNLVRVSPDISIPDMRGLLHRLYHEYNAERQYNYAQEACQFYDYRAMGKRLARDIEHMRKNYASATSAVS